MKTAIVAFNLGGPDGPAAVRPFLFNLFFDPLIIRAPGPVRWLIAQLISRRRTPVAQEIYAHIGGGSPILAQTREQAAALESEIGDADTKLFVGMRYWHPFAEECAAEVKAWGPERIVLLPLYPQFSTSTTESFCRVWATAARQAGLTAETRTVCCYPVEPGFVAATAALIREKLARISGPQTPRVLFSAHGLPEKFIESGDPYCAQVEMTVAAVVTALAGENFEHRLCYQSRVGPLEWVKPYTDAEIRRAGAEGMPLVVVPIAFVSEHSETLVELDIEYGKLARNSGVPQYERVPAVATHPDFIRGLARLVRETLDRPPGLAPDGGARICDAKWGACPCRS